MVDYDAEIFAIAQIVKDSSDGDVVLYAPRSMAHHLTAAKAEGKAGLANVEIRMKDYLGREWVMFNAKGMAAFAINLRTKTQLSVIDGGAEEE